jgi:hypothetical protein
MLKDVPEGFLKTAVVCSLAGMGAPRPALLYRHFVGGKTLHRAEARQAEDLLTRRYSN